jgi:ketosteroid isomerase-like protein
MSGSIGVADELRAAYRAGPSAGHAVMASLFGESVVLRHDPPLPTDGPIPGGFLREMSGLETAAAHRALPDLRYESVDVSGDDDAVRVRATVTGTLATGEVVAVTTDVLLELSDGRIVGLTGALGPDDQEQWSAVLAAGGFEVPPELLEMLTAGSAG